MLYLRPKNGRYEISRFSAIQIAMFTSIGNIIGMVLGLIIAKCL